MNGERKFYDKMNQKLIQSTDITSLIMIMWKDISRITMTDGVSTILQGDITQQVIQLQDTLIRTNQDLKVHTTITLMGRTVVQTIVQEIVHIEIALAAGLITLRWRHQRKNNDTMDMEEILSTIIVKLTLAIGIRLIIIRKKHEYNNR